MQLFEVLVRVKDGGRTGKMERARWGASQCKKKTQKLNAFRHACKSSCGNSWGKGKKGKVDKKPNIRYFYKYEMLPARCLFYAGKETRFF
jgi:hypothetical protein